MKRRRVYGMNMIMHILVFFIYTALQTCFCWVQLISPYSISPCHYHAQKMSMVKTQPYVIDDSPAKNIQDLHESAEIRKAEWKDLSQVSRLLVTEFYGHTPWYPAQCLSELNRLQLNFHFETAKHLMLVATDFTAGKIIGFVDIDARELPYDKRIGAPPRPYLSDLAVSVNHRRQGIGTQLVKECEQACLAWGYSYVFLKVQAKNNAGLGLYDGLGYLTEFPADEKDQLLLSKKLVP